MKMPTTTDTKAKKEPKAPKSVDSNTEKSEGEFVDAGLQCLTFLEKKMRNLEKRKKRMEINKQKAQEGVKLTQEAEHSLKQYDMIAQELEFAAELHKQFAQINEKQEETMKKKAKKEIKRIEEILKLQFTLDQLGGDNVRQDFMTGKHGAVVLTQGNLDHLDALYQVISPTRESQEKDAKYAKKLHAASEHLVNFVNGEERKVVGTTYKNLKDLVTLINGCGYFERAPKVEVQEKSRDQPVEVVEEVPEKVEQQQHKKVEEPEPVTEQKSVEPETPTASDIAQSVEEPKAQPLNTLEQDAFFAPSSSPYQQQQSSSSVNNATTTPFSSQSSSSTTTNNNIHNNNTAAAASAPPKTNNKQQASLPDIQSFTHNRPFQFIQTSYVMPDSNSPSMVDPAVIAAQPAGAHGLQFMSPLYDASAPSVVTTTSSVGQQQQQQSQQPSQQQHQSASGLVSLSQQQQQQQPQTNAAAPAPAAVNALGMPVDLSQGPVDLSQSSSAVKQQHQQQTPPPAQQQQQQQQPAVAPKAQDFNVQSSFPQSDNSSSLFPTPSVTHHNNEDRTSSNTLSNSHSDSRGPRNSAPSLRDDNISSINYEIPPSIPMPPSQDPSQEPQEKKSPMNANAPVFQSMYAQGGPPHHQVNMSHQQSSVKSADVQVPSAQSEFTPSFFGGPSGDSVGAGDFQSGYQGSNGFSNGNYGRGPGGNRGGYRGPRGGSNSTGGPGNNMNSRNGGGSYQNYGGPNPGYRSDFQSASYGSNSFGNTNNYAKRGGMNNNMGGYPPRAAGIGGNNNRGGGGAMRGGMPRGGPRGGPHRGGFSRPQ